MCIRLGGTNKSTASSTGRSTRSKSGSTITREPQGCRTSRRNSAVCCVSNSRERKTTRWGSLRRAGRRSGIISTVFVPMRAEVRGIFYIKSKVFEANRIDPLGYEPNFVRLGMESLCEFLVKFILLLVMEGSKQARLEWVGGKRCL